MSAQENEALVRRYFEEAWVKRNLAAVDEFMVPNYVEHQIPDGRLTSRDSLKQLLAMYYKAFPDMKSVLHDIHLATTFKLVQIEYQWPSWAAGLERPPLLTRRVVRSWRATRRSL
jgi:hypothetical protein